MKVQVTNNSKFPIYVDVVGNDDLKNVHILGPKAKEILDFSSSNQVEAIKAQFGSSLIIKVME